MWGCREISFSDSSIIFVTLRPEEPARRGVPDFLRPEEPARPGEPARREDLVFVRPEYLVSIRPEPPAFLLPGIREAGICRAYRKYFHRQWRPW